MSFYVIVEIGRSFGLRVDLVEMVWDLGGFAGLESFFGLINLGWGGGVKCACTGSHFYWVR